MLYVASYALSTCRPSTAPPKPFLEHITYRVKEIHRPRERGIFCDDIFTPPPGHWVVTPHLAGTFFWPKSMRFCRSRSSR